MSFGRLWIAGCIIVGLALICPFPDRRLVRLVSECELSLPRGWLPPPGCQWLHFRDRLLKIAGF